MTKNLQIVEHVIVTFVEAAGAYLIVIPTVSWSKAVIAGAVGAGLSGVYNVLRQSNPTTPVITVSPEIPVPPANYSEETASIPSK